MTQANNIILVLQARMNSSRLPAKVLLPVNGVPLVVLAARRAQNSGLPLIVVTSSEATDDPLTHVLKQNNIRYFRGDLNNVLARFVHALEGYNESTIVVRLTADNVFPDGTFIQEVLDEFQAKNLDYICTTGDESGLPYGTSLEITKLSHLREALEKSKSSFDQEHVTPYVRNKYGTKIFQKYQASGMAHFRCTVDCFEDYIKIQKIFTDMTDMFDVSVEKLILNLKKENPQIIAVKATSDLVLGAAQLGMNYGIANIDGKPDSKIAEEILKTAIDNGVKYIDTARAYGESESQISSLYRSNWGGRFKLITKLKPLSVLKTEINGGNSLQNLTYLSVLESLFNLQTNYIDVFLLHHAKDMLLENGAVWQCLLGLKQKNIIGALGVSVQSPEELLGVLDNEDVNHIQLPFNLLDHRWDDTVNKIEKTKRERPLEIHVRSVFLQGLLLSSNNEHWLRANIDNGKEVISYLQSCSLQYERASIADLCVAYARAHQWIDGLVIGMESTTQLIQNIKLFNQPALSQAQVEAFNCLRPHLLESSLNPAMWKVSL